MVTMGEPAPHACPARTAVSEVGHDLASGRPHGGRPLAIPPQKVWGIPLAPENGRSSPTPGGCGILAGQHLFQAFVPGALWLWPKLSLYCANSRCPTMTVTAMSCKLDGSEGSTVVQPDENRCGWDLGPEVIVGGLEIYHSFQASGKASGCFQ